MKSIYSAIDEFLFRTRLLNDVKSKTHRAVLEAVFSAPGPLNVTQIQHSTRLPQSSVSGALSDLKNVGLIVEGDKKGKSVYYRVNAEIHAKWIDWIENAIQTIPT